MRGMFCELLVVVAFAARTAICLEKYWLPDLEWQTAKNWMDKRIPEVDSHVVFPLETRHAVGIVKSGDLRLAGIDLARSGSLVLPRDGRLELSESVEATTKVRRWSREGHFFWADPENWNGSSEAAPHLERVPCRQDDIVLPEWNRTFSILLPMRDIQVRSVRSLDQKYPFTSWQWEDLERGREFGRGLVTVNYAMYNCEKCPCQDDEYGYYLEEICAIQRPRCGFTPCEFPLRVEGHCCRYCGGRLFLSSETSLAMVRIATNEALEGYAERIAWHVRRSWDGGIEVLIKEKADYAGIDVLKAVEDVKTMLQSSGIEVLDTETAGAALRENRLAVTLVPLFGTPLLVLVLFLLSFLYFGYSARHILSSCGEIFSSIRDGVRANKSQSSKPFSFARFKNTSEGNVQIADPASNDEQGTGDEGGNEEELSGGRFENPLYRSKKRRKEEEKILDMEAPLSLSALRDKVEDHIEEVELDIDQ